jgi:hypothetical protein
MGKYTVPTVTPERWMAVFSLFNDTFRTATIQELRAALLDLAEYTIDLTAECPDEGTRAASIMEIAFTFLETNPAGSCPDSINVN